MKRQTSLPNPILLLAAIVITWASCQQPEKPHPICFPGKHVIPDTVAAKYQMRFIESYKILKRIAPDTFLVHHFRIPNAETFSREAICALIFQPGVDSVRVFYGEDSTGGFRLMLKGVDHKGNVIVIKFPKPGVSDTAGLSTNLPQDDGDALENGQTCPPCMVNGNVPPPNN
jgi:hypothetical protein